jgi:hypothetical protein
MYGNLVASFGTSYTTCGWYHGGINMCKWGVDHPKDPTSGLKGGLLNKFPLGELPLNESLGCLPFGG